MGRSADSKETFVVEFTTERRSQLLMLLRASHTGLQFYQRRSGVDCLEMRIVRGKRLRRRLEWFGLAAGMTIVPLLPRRVCYALGQLLGTLGYFFDVKGRAVALSNIEAALGGEHNARARRTIALRCYRTFATTLIDLLWSSQLTPKNFRRYIEIEGLERAEAESGERRSAIAVSIHYGNFEWLSLAMGFLGYPGDIVAERQKNPLIEPLMHRARIRSGHTVIPRKGAVVRLYKTLRRGGRVAILIDLNVRPAQPAVIINCFGLETCVTLAHTWLHQRTGATIIPAHCEPLPGGRYRVVCHPRVEIAPSATATEIAQACWNSFEPVIRRHPAPWLWMYKHWRFQPKTSTRKYPFYANTSPHFEKLKKRLRTAEATTTVQPAAAS
jgi:Kdo2-lipid IVA lauroyltransferase/acyltransferase